MTKVTAEDLATLIQMFDASDWREMHLTVGGTDLFLSKDPYATGPYRAALVATSAATAPAEPASAPQAGPITAAPTAAPAARHRGEMPAGWTAIRAPNLGTFYRAPKPGASPYVEIGQAVTPETEVCLIEVMKLFTAVRAGITGTIKDVCVADGEMVEFDQPLFLIAPND